ncbi:hypothetical protein [Mycobacterium neglectum]|uniref:hypothetical protein n=1 Tax=Mycobacterium neglectum TaxID=242737 RepID=UPI0011456F78|nr:hypothetical protein [Mycobacterium neglectum]
MSPRPLVKRTPEGHRYVVPPAPRRNGAPPPQQPTDDHADGPEPTPAQQPDRRAKLDANDVREARAMHAAGRFGVGDLAYIFGVSQSNMSAVINRHSWRDVEDDA